MKAGSTEGRVTRLWRHSGDNKNQPSVAYQFVIGERVYARNAKLPVKAWRNLRVGSSLPGAICRVCTNSEILCAGA